MYVLTWLWGLLRRRPMRVAGTVAGVAIAVALLGSLGAFFAASKAQMTKRAVAGVIVDWQVQITPGTNPVTAGPTIAAAPGVANRRWRSLAMGSYTQLSFTEQVKRCSACGQVKARTEFHRATQNRDGLAGRCKSCIRAYNKRWCTENAEHLREWGRAYRARKSSIAKELCKDFVACRVSDCSLIDLI